MFVRILRGRDFLLRLGSRVYVAVVFLIICGMRTAVTPEAFHGLGFRCGEGWRWQQPKQQEGSNGEKKMSGKE